MVSANFDQEVRADTQEKLRLLFGDDQLYMEEGASVTFSGRISLGRGVVFAGINRLDDGTTVASGCEIQNCTFGRANTIRPYSILTGVTAGKRNIFGPFCFVRDDCVVGDDCILGAHVEATRSSFANGVKISHRAFIGDASIGERTIIGAGVVFCNFDGERRQTSELASDVLIGSGTLLIAPVSIGAKAVVGAGSVVTKPVAQSERVLQKRGPAARSHRQMQ